MPSRRIASTCTQSGIRTRRHSCLRRVAHPLAYLGDARNRGQDWREWKVEIANRHGLPFVPLTPIYFLSGAAAVDSSGLAPESSVCRTEIFLLDDEPATSVLPRKSNE